MSYKGQLVYIGQTKNLRKRMFDHFYRFNHDCIRWIECQEHKLLEYEKRLIKIFKPYWNVAHNTNNPNRDKISPYFKTPSWMYHYEQMSYYYPGLSEQENNHKKLIHKLEFEFLYNQYGYGKSILDY